jgi:hypothetical protein
MTQIVWTVLPNGGDSQVLKVSLFLSLRLSGPPDNLPTTVLGLASSLSLAFADASGNATAALPLTLDTSLMSAGLWDSVFPSTATVTPWVSKKMKSRTVLSYPVREVRQDVEELYTEMAELYGVVPPRFRVTDPNSKLQQFIGLRGRELTNFETPTPGVHVSFVTPTGQPTSPKGLPAVSDLATTSAFYRASRFYRRNLNPDPGVTPPPDLQRPPPPAPFVPTTLDAHQAMAALADHPQLLRRFGLVIDATVPRPSALPGVKAKVAFAAPRAGDMTPYTFCTLNGNVFVATPNSDPKLGGELSDGLLRLGDTSIYEIQQLDVDSAALKLGDFAANQATTSDLVTSSAMNQTNAPTTEVPTLQTAGIVVARVGRADRLTDRLSRGEDLETDTVGLFAEDITRGYRVDVQNTADGVWRSLSARHGAYLVGPTKQRVPATGEFHDEGYVKQTGATSDDTTSTTKHIYLHETIFGWDGWSQVVRAPGRTIQFVQTSVDSDGKVHGQETVSRIESTADQGEFKVEPQFKVEPGTLPKLRFGQTYRLRARAVDLAGNSLPLSTPGTDITTSTPLTVHRHEPVPPPPLVLRRPLVEGESVEHIVIRTKSGTPTGVDPSVFFSTNDRHVPPPSGSFELALRSGSVDPTFGTPLAYNLGLKSEGTLYDTSVYDTVLGIKVPVLGLQVINTPEAAGLPTAFPTNRGDGLQTGQYVIHTEPLLRLPYLPDPLAAGFAINDGRDVALQTSAVGSHQVAYAGAWPDLIPPKLTVTSTSASTPSVSSGLGGITVNLPPGTILPLTLSSTLPSGSLGKFAIWNLVGAAKQSSLQSAALAGQHWMLTPKRYILAVNAVEKPLAPAQFTSLAISPARNPGETFVKLAGTMTGHFHSTGQLDIEASWSDHVDRLSDPGPTDEPHAHHVFTTHPGYDDTTSVVPLPWSTTPPTPTPESYIPKHDFGDTKHRVVQYRADATTRYREYFPASVAATPTNIVFPGIQFQVSVPSSERPKAPEVLYVVPTFKWQSTNNTGLLAPTNSTSQRVGRALRIYLSRPWFSSGVGEQLAVVIKGQTATSDATLRYTTEWGADPVYRTPTGDIPTRELAASDFPTATAVTPNTMTISEDASVLVQAVAYDVQYNSDRKVWYVDVEFGPQTMNTPFVRLALARYQASSVPGLELSPIVKADFAQLVNDRTASLQFVGPLNQAIKVSVHGIATHNHLGDVMATLPVTGTAPTPPTGYVFNRNAGQGRVVTAQIEQLSLGQSEVEWTPVGSPTILPSFVATASPGNDVMWYGSVPAPTRPLTVTNRRLVIREIELFDTDVETVDTTVTVPLPSGATVRGRVVYLDVLPFSDLDFI